MGYEIHYSDADKDRASEDRRAINDAIQFIGLRRMKILIRELKKCKTAADFQSMNSYFGFCGVTGRPFFACGRRWAPAASEAWWADPKFG